MNVPVLNRRSQILHRGLDLVTTLGFSGVTIGTLAERTGMSKSGLFAHFGSKEELQLALLDQTARVFDETVLKSAMAAPEGLARLQALVHNWLGWTQRASLEGGCPVASGMFELDDQSGPVREQLLMMEKRWRGVLAEVTAQAVERGQLRSELDLEQFVWELCGIYLSHHASARFVKDPEADVRAQRAVSALIHRSSKPYS